MKRPTVILPLFALTFFVVGACNPRTVPSPETIPCTSAPEAPEGYTLLWNDEFEGEGKPNPEWWSSENGFTRNRELQWYRLENANLGGGVLRLTAKKERVENPEYDAESSDWRLNRECAEYTSGSIRTHGKKEFLYGLFEIRARIPAVNGSWPAIWTTGVSMPWPSRGEIDIMEFFMVDGVPRLLANTAYGTDVLGEAKWDTERIPLAQFLQKDPAWAEKFHLWKMDWTEDHIRLYLDGELLNETLLAETFNGAPGEYKNPFRQPHGLILNLAIDLPSRSQSPDPFLPMTYEVDYVRVYQKDKE